MTEHEYTAMVEEIGNTFPALGDWFSRLSPGEKEAQRKRRRSALIDLDTPDVRQAIGEFSTSADCPWSGYGQMEWAYAAIARRARDIRGKRIEAARNAETLSAGTKYESPAIIGAVRQEAIDFADAMKRGELPNAKAIADWFDDRHGPSEDKRDRAQCGICRDTGYVAIVASVKRYGDRLTWTTSSTACPCGLGQARNGTRGEAARLVTYDDAEHVRVKTFATVEDVAAEYQATKRRNEKRKRIGSFDDFNARNQETFA